MISIAMSKSKVNRVSTVQLFLIGFLCHNQHVVGFDPSQFRVSGLEEIEPAFKEFDGEMFAGFLPIDEDAVGTTKNHNEESKAEISFWLFAPSEKKDTLTVWLNGGPGCSSFHAGLIMECSPVTTPHYPAGHGKCN